MDDKITIDFNKLSVVPISEVRPNTYNPKDKDTKEYAEVKASILENGLMGFIVVRENPTDVSKYEIIDGEQRWTACKEVGFENIVIYNHGQVDDKRARELTLWWDTRVEKNELSLAKMITEMVEKYGEVSTPFTQKKIEEMQELARFNFDNYKKTSTTPPPPPTGEMLQSFMVQLTKDQLDIVQQAMGKVKQTAETDMSDGRALEMICVEYLNQPEGQ